MTTPNLPQLDTPEARWAYVLKLWRERSLPTPENINVNGDLTIWLPDNERGQVDQWAAALGIDPARVHSANRTDGSPNTNAHYSASSYSAPGTRWVMCRLDLNADASAHGGPVARTELAAAMDGVVAMLGGA